MLEDCGAPVVLTQRSLLARLPAMAALCLDEPDALPAGLPATVELIVGSHHPIDNVL
jgi:hypothetical protein